MLEISDSLKGRIKEEQKDHIRIELEQQFEVFFIYLENIKFSYQELVFLEFISFQ